MPQLFSEDGAISQLISPQTADVCISTDFSNFVSWSQTNKI